MRQAVHRAIADVTRDIERWSYNTAVAHCMELLNLVQRYGRGEGEEGPHGEVWAEALDACSSCSLLWRRTSRPSCGRSAIRGSPRCIAHSWPVFDPELVRQDTVTMVVQVNGKVNDRIEVDAGISEADAEDAHSPHPRWSRPWPGPRPSGWWSSRPAWSTS